MKNITSLSIVISVMMVLFYACKHEPKEDAPVPQEEEQQNLDECNTVTVSFSETVFPVLQNNCISCHSNSNPSGGVVLETHSNVQAIALDGTLYGAINHENGFSAMPPGQKLNACTIAKIKSWIDNGAEDN